MEDDQNGKRRLKTLHRTIRSRCTRLEMLLLLVVGAVAGWEMLTPDTISAQAKTKVNAADGLTYVWIPPGTFQMGCSPEDSECKDLEKPAHSATLTQGFWIAQTLVTQAAYKKVIGASPSKFKGDQLPVENVSWTNRKLIVRA